LKAEPEKPAKQHRPAHSPFGRHRKLVHGQHAFVRKRSISGEANIAPVTRIRDVLRNEIFLDEEKIFQAKKKNVTSSEKNYTLDG